MKKRTPTGLRLEAPAAAQKLWRGKTTRQDAQRRMNWRGRRGPSFAQKQLRRAGARGEMPMVQKFEDDDDDEDEEDSLCPIQV